MCVKLPPGDLNLGLYPSHPTSIYTCGVTIAPRVCGGTFFFSFQWCCVVVLLFMTVIKLYLILKSILKFSHVLHKHNKKLKRAYINKIHIHHTHIHLDQVRIEFLSCIKKISNYHFFFPFKVKGSILILKCSVLFLKVSHVLHIYNKS